MSPQTSENEWKKARMESFQTHKAEAEETSQTTEEEFQGWEQITEEGGLICEWRRGDVIKQEEQKTQGGQIFTD